MSKHEVLPVQSGITDDKHRVAQNIHYSNAEIHPSAQESSDLESESEIANEEDSD